MILDMICRCSPEGIAEADALLARVRAAMSDPPIDEKELVSAIVMELNWKHGAYVELAADQWFGVRVLKYDGEQLVRVECDHIEDGLAACWEELKEGNESADEA